MRKSKDEAVKTRERIVMAASAQFRENGVAGTGLSDLMAAAGLTHGGFYKHFSSKDQVVSEACRFALGDRAEAFRHQAALCPEGAGLRAVVTRYLSTEHRDNKSGGCMLVAIGSEISRGSDITRAVASEEFQRFVDLIASLLPLQFQGDRNERAIAIVSGMIGALTLARIASTAKISNRILTSARNQILESWT